MASLRGSIGKLGGQHQPLHRAQKAKTNYDRERQPNHQVNPDRRMKFDLGKERSKGHQKAGNHDHKHGRTIAAIGLGQIITTGLAFGRHPKKSFEQWPFPAVGAVADQSRQQWVVASQCDPLDVSADGLPEDDIDEGKQEQPDHVNEVPVPSCGLKTKVLLRREPTADHPEQADTEEDRSD